MCSKGLSPLVIFENGTVDHNRYINEVLPVVLNYGNSIFGNDWTFQPDDAKPHFHEKTEEWCTNNFPSFIQRDHWPPNSPDLNPLNYCSGDQLGKTIKWNRVTSKKITNCRVKTNCKRSVVFESCWSWTNRLYRMSQNEGNYLR